MILLSRPYSSRRTAGFTLLEVMIALTLLVLALVIAGVGLQASSLTTREIADRLIIQTQAQDYLDLILAQPFGNVLSSDPTTTQLEEIFDDDDIPGTITLHQLSRWPVGEGGWRFSLANTAMPGEWRVQVDTDIDDDGVVGTATADNPLWTESDRNVLAPLESGGTVFRIRIFYNGDLVLSTNRAKEVSL